MKRDLKLILSNQRGVALMMIMTAIILLMAIYGEFTFDSKISRLKATNVLDRAQAKLLAESGLQLAMARLRLYKEAYNYVQANENAKNVVQPQLLNQLWEVPFMFPIPAGAGMSAAFKDTVKKFEDESLLDGQMKVLIQNVANKMNLNLLRVSMLDNSKQNTSTGNDDDEDNQRNLDMSDNGIMSNVSVDQSLYFLLKRLVDERKMKDEAFNDRNGDLNYQELVTNLKFFMSDPGSLNRDPLAGEAENKFQRIPLTPKYGPLSSASELYVIPGWNDELIELIQGEYSVYPSTQIDLNKITANMLKILLPMLTDEQVQDFFLYRDDEKQPKHFKDLADFRKYFVDERVLDATVFDNRMQLFQKKGITFGATPDLFKVISEGTYNRSTYTLVAYVLLPKREQTKKKDCPDGQIKKGNPPQCQPMTDEEKAAAQDDQSGGNQGGTGAQGEQNAQVLDPRIIEIQVN